MVIDDNKTYIVSLGDTRKYRVKGSELKKYSEELKKYLSSEFDGEALTYYDTANVEEGDAAKYPELTHVEFEKVKTDLKRQIEVRNTDAEMDSDAPYSDVNKSAI
ncbi:MAG: hypothetical protein K2H18_07055 [Muribaculaceae bacterium]|nr:hypothetical protein [Muribaculaceae bacterium]